jgi:hypothetical protein
MRLMSRALVAGTLLSIFGIALAGSTPEKGLEEIASYRQWTRVTPKPVVVDFPSPGG